MFSSIPEWQPQGRNLHGATTWLSSARKRESHLQAKKIAVRVEAICTVLEPDIYNMAIPSKAQQIRVSSFKQKRQV
jgi:hypothetical protein